MPGRVIVPSFPTNTPNPILFSFNSNRKIPDKTHDKTPAV